MKTLELSSGLTAQIKYSIIDLDGSNLEEGVDVYVENEYIGSLLGLTEDEVTEDDIFNLQ